MLWGRLGALEVLVHRQALCLETGSVTVYRPLLSPSCLLPGLLGASRRFPNPNQTAPLWALLPHLLLSPSSESPSILLSTLVLLAICLSLLGRQHLRAQRKPQFSLHHSTSVMPQMNNATHSDHLTKVSSERKMSYYLITCHA